MVVPVFVTKSRLSSFLLGYLVLNFSELLPEFSNAPLLTLFPPDCIQKLITAGAISIVFVADGVFLVIILMICLGRVKGLGRQNRRDYGFVVDSPFI